jgi:hypothetical protein
MSLGGGVDETPAVDGGTPLANTVLCRAVAEAVAANIPVVVAAGNDGASGNPLSAPAACPGAISVGALNEDNNITYWSSFDPSVTVMAPGADILSTMPVWETSPFYPYGEMSGTSMATPVVSGVVALARSVHPDWTVAQIKDALTSTAYDLGPAGDDPKYGYGLVDAAAVVGAGAPRTSLAPTPKLILDMRLAISDKPNVFTADWDVPTRSTLPESYTIKVYNRAGEQANTYTFDGKQVRFTFETPDSWTGGFWVTMTANYADGTVLQATPFNTLGAAPQMQNVQFTKGMVTDSKGNQSEGYTITWDPYNGADARYITVEAYGPHMYDYLVSYPRDLKTGDLPTSATIAFSDLQGWPGQKFTDSDVTINVAGTNSKHFGVADSIYAITKTVNGTQPLVFSGFIFDKTDTTHAWFTVATTASKAKALCNGIMECDRVKVTVHAKVTYTVTTKVHGKNATSVKTKNIVKVVKLGDHSTYGGESEMSNFKVPATTTKITAFLVSSTHKETSRTYVVFDAKRDAANYNLTND